MREREREQRRKRVFHFDPHLKRMTTLDEEPGGSLWYHAKGAPVELLDRCMAVIGADGTEVKLGDAERQQAQEAFERYAAQGLRVLGFSRAVPWHTSRTAAGRRSSRR
jgi:magnesium-transporting ATPase (P-type)